MLYSSSFVGTLVKNEIPEASLELCQLKIKQLSPDIFKFRTKHENNQDNPFTLNCFVVSHSFLFIFHAARVDWVLIIFGTQVIKKKRPVRPVFPDYLSVSYDYGISICVYCICQGYVTSKFKKVSEKNSIFCWKLWLFNV